MEGEISLERFLDKMGTDSLYRKAINQQMKHFDIKCKELLKTTPKAVKHQQ